MPELWQGTSPLIGLPGPSQGAPSPTGRILQTGCPLILPNSGSVAANGALTLGTALDNTYPKCYMFLPAGAAFGGSPAGMYYVEMASTTVGVIFNNLYLGERPDWPNILTKVPIVAAGPGAYATAVATDFTLCQFTVAAGALGPNGILSIRQMVGVHNNANAKTIKHNFGGQLAASYAMSGIAQAQGRFVTEIQVQNNQSIQASNGNNTYGTSQAIQRLTVDTTLPVLVTLTAQIAVATDNVAFESLHVTTGFAG